MSIDALDQIFSGGVDLGPLVNNYERVKELQRAISLTPQNISLLRSGLAACLKDDAWARRYDPHTDTPILYTWEGPAEKREQFICFVTEPPPRGLNTDVPTLRKLLDGHPAELAELDLLLAKGPGGANNPGGTPMERGEDGAFTAKAERPVNGDDITVDRPVPKPESVAKRQGGTSTAYAHRRLARDRPDLLEKVKAGEMKPHAAMVEAGFRRVPTPLEVLRRAWERASEPDRLAFLEHLRHHGWLPPAQE